MSDLRNGWVLISADADLFEGMNKYGEASENAPLFEAA
jgi:hypothetical protein